ncbi:unnamed protein product, partial [Allacma fusca]
MGFTKSRGGRMYLLIFIVLIFLQFSHAEEAAEEEKPPTPVPED